MLQYQSRSRSRSCASGLIKRLRAAEQEGILFGLVVAVFVVASLAVPGFLDWGNILDSVVDQSPLLVFALAMTALVIGGNLDFSLVIVAVVSVEISMQMAESGTGLAVAVGVGVAVACAAGVANGVLVSIVEIPPIFATIGTGLLALGIARLTFFGEPSYPTPDQAEPLLSVMAGTVLGVPVQLVIVAAVAALTHGVLTRTVPGRLLFAQGDNYAAARVTGMAVRRTTTVSFAIAAVIAFVAALGLAAQGRALSHVQVTGSLLYDVIVVVVIGGVSLAGGRGSVRGVLAGGLLIAFLLNAMTLLDLTAEVKDIVKGGVLIGALALDAVLHPRDVDRARAGDL